MLRGISQITFFISLSFCSKGSLSKYLSVSLTACLQGPLSFWFFSNLQYLNIGLLSPVTEVREVTGFLLLNRSFPLAHTSQCRGTTFKRTCSAIGCCPQLAVSSQPRRGKKEISETKYFCNQQSTSNPIWKTCGTNVS